MVANSTLGAGIGFQKRAIRSFRPVVRGDSKRRMTFADAVNYWRQTRRFTAKVVTADWAAMPTDLHEDIVRIANDVIKTIKYPLGQVKYGTADIVALVRKNPRYMWSYLAMLAAIRMADRILEAREAAHPELQAAIKLRLEEALSEAPRRSALSEAEARELFRSL